MNEHDLFELLVKEHSTALRMFLRAALRDDNQADDLFQETFVQAWRHRDRYDKNRSFGKWLRGIAMNLIREYRRQLARRPRQLEDDVLELLDARCEAFQSHRHDTLDDELAGLKTCLAELPEHFRHAVVTRYQLGIRGRELAEALAVSVENAKKRLQRGRTLLQACLHGKLAPGLSPSPEAGPTPFGGVR